MLCSWDDGGDFAHPEVGHEGHLHKPRPRDRQRTMLPANGSRRKSETGFGGRMLRSCGGEGSSKRRMISCGKKKSIESIGASSTRPNCNGNGAGACIWLS